MAGFCSTHRLGSCATSSCLPAEGLRHRQGTAMKVQAQLWADTWAHWDLENSRRGKTRSFDRFIKKLSSCFWQHLSFFDSHWDWLSLVVFDFSCPGGGVHGGTTQRLCLHFPDIWCQTSFHVFIDQLQTFLSEMSAHLFFLFLQPYIVSFIPLAILL